MSELTKEIHGVPLWGWLVGGAGGVGVGLYLRHRGSASQVAADAAGATLPDIPTTQGAVMGSGGLAGDPSQSPPVTSAPDYSDGFLAVIAGQTKELAVLQAIQKNGLVTHSASPIATPPVHHKGKRVHSGMGPDEHRRRRRRRKHKGATPNVIADVATLKHHRHHRRLTGGGLHYTPPKHHRHHHHHVPVPPHPAPNWSGRK